MALIYNYSHLLYLINFMKVFIQNILYTLLVVIIGVLVILFFSFLTKEYSLRNMSDLSGFLSRLIGLLTVIIIAKSFNLFNSFFSEKLKSKHIFWVVSLSLIYIFISNIIPFLIFGDFFRGDNELSFLNYFDYFLITPFLEELFFRGVIQKKFNKHFNWYIAIILTSLLFPLIHSNFDQYFFYFLFSIFSGYLFYKFNSLKASFLFHAFSNILASIIYHFF